MEKTLQRHARVCVRLHDLLIELQEKVIDSQNIYLVVKVTALGKYFRVRAYKTSDGETVYGTWSSAKKAAVKGASTITYKTSEFSLKLPSNWKGNYIAEQSTFDGIAWLAFYEKNCYQELDLQ